MLSVNLVDLAACKPLPPQQRSRWDTFSDVMATKAGSDAVAEVAKNLERNRFQNAYSNFVTLKPSLSYTI